MRKILFSVKLIALMLLVFVSAGVKAQDLNVITTGVPFLMISPDARGGSMGDVGVASTPTLNSMYWNPAKYAFIEGDMGLGISYSPWLRDLVDDMGLSQVNFFKRLDDRQVVAASLRYFSLGSINFTDQSGESQGSYSPNQWAIDAAYSRKLTDKLSLAVAGRFIYSNLTLGQSVGGAETRAGTSVAADVALYYTTPLELSSVDADFAFGVNISNIGSKISYTTDVEKDFIPTNLRFGPSLNLNLDSYNTVSFNLDFNKLLVPTPPIYDEDGEEIVSGMDPDVSVMTGMLQSFYDAPDGFSEELRELSMGFGVEYWYDKQFAIRAGYFYEDETKGNRKFFTLGAGLKYNVFALDFSYLIPTEQKNPLDNTLRFSLTFDFDSFNAQRK